ncbi:hypothetical protein NQ318_003908 [Aromia moschata]|uniref:Peroxisomal membrane protein PMP34 n=1 Tax=Aromia moschata TaxID=1265417 RepID=A0AAV8ZA59_9CUCU|nr:hypothetical protein NQ318_003908 [Aromia moschata]
MSVSVNFESLVHATAGATGSVFAMVCLYPLDNIKFRMQLDDTELLDKTTLQAIIHILRTEGINSLYRGIKPVITTLGVSNFVYFYAFHGLKSLLPKHAESAKTDLIISMAAGVVNVLLTTPLWVVNNRLKTSEDLTYTGLLDGLRHVANTEGVGALWNGLGPSLVLVSNPAIHFTAYEFLKRRVDVKSATAFFVLGALSKTLATVVTYPLQLAQTRQRLSKDTNLSTVALLLLILKRNGPGRPVPGPGEQDVADRAHGGVDVHDVREDCSTGFRSVVEEPEEKVISVSSITNFMDTIGKGTS